MKINVERKSLLTNLQVATTAIGTKSTIPILDEALIEVSENKMVITTSNTQITLALNLACETEGELRDFVCDIDTILSTISLLKSEVITLEVTEDTVLFSTPKTRKRYEVPMIYKADDFPIPSAKKWGETTTINGGMFAKMIKRTALFVNPNDLRIGMTGMNIKGTEDTFTIQGTNASVITGCSVNKEDNELNVLKEFNSIIVPRNISNISMHFEKSVKLEMSVDSGSKMLRLYDGSITCFVLLLDGAFPGVEPLLNQKVSDVNFKVNRESLLLALKRSSLFSDYASKTVKLDMIGENLVLKSDNNNRKKSEELVELDNKSEEINFVTGFNHTFLISIINTMEGEDIYFSQTAFNKPGFLEDNASEGFNTSWMIAPLHIAEHVPNKD